MSEMFDARHCWLGVGMKVGGQLIGGGVESTTGYVFNVENPSIGAGFTIENIRIGPGLGGGVGGVLLIVLDCRSIYTLDGTDLLDWGVNVAFGAKLDSLVKLLRAAKEFDALWPVARTLLKGVGQLRSGAVQAGRAAAPALAGIGMAADDFETMKTAVNYAWNAHSTLSRDGNPLIIALDIPGVGYGLELSLVAMAGKFSIQG